jgi:hypothetical protein
LAYWGFTRTVARCTGVERTKAMLDVAYILVGAVFLGACVLYAFTCDRL